MKDYAEFINRLFESREQSHVFHLQTNSHAEHLALQEYYEGVLEFIDTLVESWQGKYLETLDGYDIIKVNDIDKSDVLNYFIELSKWVEENKSNYIKEYDTFLFNIVDEILVLLYKTIYKLKFLK